MLATSPVGSTHTEYVEDIWTCSTAAFLPFTHVRLWRGISDGPMLTAAHRISTTLAAKDDLHEPGGTQPEGHSKHMDAGIRELVYYSTKSLTRTLLKLDH